MIRILLKAWNAPGLILIGLLMISIQTAVFQSPSAKLFQPDLLLFLILWCAVKRPFTEGGILVLILANIAELHTSSPQGVTLCSSMLVYLLLRLLNKLLVVSSYVPLTIFAAVTWKISSMVILESIGGGHQWLHVMEFLFPNVLVDIAFAPIAYRFLIYYDRITFEDPLYTHALDRGFQLEDEGL